MNWETIVNWTHGALGQADETCIPARNALDTCSDDCFAIRTGMESTGFTAEAFKSRLLQHEAKLDDFVAAVSELMMACAAATDGVWEVETAVLECRQFAEINDLVICADGSVQMGARYDELQIEVTSTPSRVAVNAIQELIKAYEAHAEQLRQMIAEACALADEVDAEFCSRLSALERDSVSLTRPGSDFAPGLPAAPLADWSPTEISVWWAALSETERRALIENDPELYGSLDGIPAVDRDRANRMVLDELLAAPKLQQYDQDLQRIYEEQLEIYESTRHIYGDEMQPPSLETAKAEWVRRNPYYADVLTVRNMLLEDPTRSLLVLDYRHDNLEVAIGVGDVDHAKNVVVHTPGILTNARDGLHRGLKELDIVLRRSRSADSELSAGVYWMDYDVPQTIVGATDTRPFMAGGELASIFLEGLRSVREANGAELYLTASGHSFGSTNTGVAVDTVKVGAVDNVVFFGSPGMGVEDARDLNVEQGRVFASLIPGDGIGGIGGGHPTGNFGNNPMNDANVNQLANRGSQPPGVPYGSKFIGEKEHTDYFTPIDGTDSNPIIDDFASVISGEY